MSVQKAELVKQLKQAGAQRMGTEGSLDTLKSNSALAKDTLERRLLLGEEIASYIFTNAPSRERPS